MFYKKVIFIIFHFSILFAQSNPEIVIYSDRANTNNIEINLENIDSQDIGTGGLSLSDLSSGQLTKTIEITKLQLGNSSIPLSISYSSNVKKYFNGHNSKYTTGVLGLGWGIPRETIYVDNNNTAFIEDNKYYYNRNGDSIRLFCIEVIEDEYIFEASLEKKKYRFCYSLSLNEWIYIDENFNTNVFGGDNSNESISYMIHWNDWIGPSNQRTNQNLTPISWEISKKIDQFGNEINYEYIQVKEKVGQEGSHPSQPQYTKSIYLSSIQDSYGKVIDFEYDKKLCNSDAREYFDPNRESPYPIDGEILETEEENCDAYQEFFQTKYLKSIKISEYDNNSIGFYKYYFDYLDDLIPGKPYIRSGEYAKRMLRKVLLKKEGTFYNEEELAFWKFEYSAENGCMTKFESSDGKIENFDYTNYSVNKNWTTQSNFSFEDDSLLKAVVNANDYVLVFREDYMAIYLWDGRWIFDKNISILFDDIFLHQSFFSNDYFVILSQNSSFPSSSYLHCFTFEPESSTFIKNDFNIQKINKDHGVEYDNWGDPDYKVFVSDELTGDTFNVKLNPHPTTPAAYDYYHYNFGVFGESDYFVFIGRRPNDYHYMTLYSKAGSTFQPIANKHYYDISQNSRRYVVSTSTNHFVISHNQSNNPIYFWHKDALGEWHENDLSSMIYESNAIYCNRMGLILSGYDGYPTFYKRPINIQDPYEWYYNISSLSLPRPHHYTDIDYKGYYMSSDIVGSHLGVSSYNGNSWVGRLIHKHNAPYRHYYYGNEFIINYANLPGYYNGRISIGYGYYYNSNLGNWEDFIVDGINFSENSIIRNANNSIVIFNYSLDDFFSFVYRDKYNQFKKYDGVNQYYHQTLNDSLRRVSLGYNILAYNGTNEELPAPSVPR